jgi:hypothetical protein
VGLAPEHPLHERLDGRHAGLAAHQQHVVDLARLQVGVRERAPARLHRPLQEVGE